MAEPEGGDEGEGEADAYDGGEGPGACGGDADVDVHAVEAGDEGWNHEDEGDACEALHDGVDVVGDDGGVGVEGSVEHLDCDGCGGVGLSHFDADVVEELAVKGVAKDSVHSLQEEIVAADRCGEDHERFLEVHELEEVFIADALLQLLLGCCDGVVYILEVTQEPIGAAVDEAEDEVRRGEDVEAALLGVVDEVSDEEAGIVADGDDIVAIDEDAEGDGHEGNLPVGAGDGDAEDSENPVGGVLQTGALVDVADVVDEVLGDTETRNQDRKVVAVRLDDVDPATGVPFADFGESFFTFEIGYHGE